MGGDEFIAILVNENYEELIINVEKMVKSIKDYNNESKYKLEVSYGYSIREKEEKTPLINIHEDADKNMYIFKNTCKRK